MARPVVIAQAQMFVGDLDIWDIWLGKLCRLVIDEFHRCSSTTGVRQFATAPQKRRCWVIYLTLRSLGQSTSLASMIAALWDTPYNIVYLVHIFSVILGVGMAFIAPMIAVRARRSSGHAMQDLVNETASKIMFPMFLVAGIAGGAMVGLSGQGAGDKAYNFQQTWLSVGGALWIVILVLTAAIYPPNWLRVFNIGEDRKAMLGGILHLSLAVMLVLMTWKFGR